MIPANTLDAGTAAALRTLAASPMVAAAQAAHDEQRATERRAVLTAMERTIADARKDERKVAEAILAQRAKVDAAHAAWQAECRQLQQLSIRENELGCVIDGARSQAYRQMRPLMDTINDTVRVLCIAQTESRGLIAYRHPADILGFDGGVPSDPGAPRLSEPAHVSRWARMGQLASEIEAMRYDASLTPGVIERRCEAARREAEDTGPAPAHASERAATRRIRPPEHRTATL